MKSFKKYFVVFLCGAVLVLFALVIVGFLYINHVKNAILSGEGVFTEVSTQNIVVMKEEMHNLGFLVTQDYLATILYDEEDHQELLGVAVAGTSSRVIFSYDVDVSAGVDCEQIDIAVDDDDQVITVTIPYAQIYGIPSLDPDSFECYLDTSGIFSSGFNLADHNDMNEDIIELAIERAEENGIIDKANENASTLIYNMIYGMTSSMPGYEDYTVVVETIEPQLPEVPVGK